MLSNRNVGQSPLHAPSHEVKVVMCYKCVFAESFCRGVSNSLRQVKLYDESIRGSVFSKLKVCIEGNRLVLAPDLRCFLGGNAEKTATASQVRRGHRW